MAFQQENPAPQFRKDFAADRDAHIANLRMLSAHLVTARDLVGLRDLGVLPGVDEVLEGSVVRVGDELHFLTSTGWKEIQLI